MVKTRIVRKGGRAKRRKRKTKQAVIGISPAEMSTERTPKHALSTEAKSGALAQPCPSSNSSYTAETLSTSSGTLSSEYQSSLTPFQSTQSFGPSPDTSQNIVEETVASSALLLPHLSNELDNCAIQESVMATGSSVIPVDIPQPHEDACDSASSLVEQDMPTSEFTCETSETSVSQRLPSEGLLSLLSETVDSNNTAMSDVAVAQEPLASKHEPVETPGFSVTEEQSTLQQTCSTGEESAVSVAPACCECDDLQADEPLTTPLSFAPAVEQGALSHSSELKEPQCFPPVPAMEQEKRENVSTPQSGRGDEVETLLPITNSPTPSGGADGLHASAGRGEAPSSCAGISKNGIDIKPIDSGPEHPSAQKQSSSPIVTQASRSSQYVEEPSERESFPQSVDPSARRHPNNAIAPDKSAKQENALPPCNSEDDRLEECNSLNMESRQSFLTSEGVPQRSDAELAAIEPTSIQTSPSPSLSPSSLEPTSSVRSRPATVSPHVLRVPEDSEDLFTSSIPDDFEVRSRSPPRSLSPPPQVLHVYFLAAYAIAGCLYLMPAAHGNISSLRTFEHRTV